MRTLLIPLFVTFAFAEKSWSVTEVGVFFPQRHVFVYAAEDADKGGLRSEISGLKSGSVGLAKKSGPAGLELNWYKNVYGGIGPLARLRFAPWAVQLRASQFTQSGLDGQIQVGHGWAGPDFGSLGIAFEFGATLRGFVSDDNKALPSTSLAGGFWSLIVSRNTWKYHAEASLLAFSLSDHGRWGKHRDSNSLRIRATRTFESTPWRAWGEFFHIHRTFTNSEFGFSRSLFVSDVTFSLGVTREL
jgi:hypothetical protein